MLVKVRDNDNVRTDYTFEPNGVSRLEELKKFYGNAYSSLRIQGFQIIDENGEVVYFGGSI